MKILIIGSKGFIGSYAVSYFSSLSNFECWGCDVVVDYVADHYFLLDASNSDFSELFSSISFDVCINCSGAASVPDSMQHPLRDFSLNTLNVAKMLEAIRKHVPHCKFVNLSSAAVYGNPSRIPITESDACVPVSPYGQHKLMAEQLCKEYCDYFNVQCCSLRIFSAYGNGLQKQLFWDITQKAQLHKDLLLFGTGKETRDFIHVIDIVRVMLLVIEKGSFDGSYYNVANGQEISIEIAAQQLTSFINPTIKIGFQGVQRMGDPINWCADISKIKNLGYEQSIGIEEGLKAYALWVTEKK